MRPYAVYAFTYSKPNEPGDVCTVLARDLNTAIRLFSNKHPTAEIREFQRGASLDIVEFL